MKPPLVLLATNMAPGGAETQACRMAVEMKRRGWPVSVVSMIRPTAFQQELAAAGVPLYSLDMKPGAPSPGAAIRCFTLLARLRPAILHAHMFHANLLARAARLVAPVPVVISTVHSIVESSRGSATAHTREMALRATSWLGDCTAAVCQAAAERYARLRIERRRKLRVVHNAADTAEFRPDPARRAATRTSLGLGGEFVWFAVGRLMWKKDYPAMLNAFSRTRGGILPVAGEGPDREELERLAARLAAPVRFLGLRRDVPALMNAANAFVMSSVLEGLPLVLVEAAASGLPCVAARVGGIPEIVLDGETGRLVPAGDQEALAAAMLKLSALETAERTRMGKHAREHAERDFSLDAAASQWERLYEELLDRSYQGVA